MSLTAVCDAYSDTWRCGWKTYRTDTTAVCDAYSDGLNDDSNSDDSDSNSDDSDGDGLTNSVV